MTAPVRAARNMFLRRLASSTADADRARAAAHPHCPDTVLKRLSVDPAWMVRSAVARAAPLHLCAGLLADEDWRVQYALADRTDLPVHVQERLLHTSHRVRMRLAENPGLAPECLAVLAVDVDPLVRAAARRNPWYPDLPEPVLVESALLDT